MKHTYSFTTCILAALLTLLVFTRSRAQNTTAKLPPNAIKSNQWQPLYSNALLEISYRYDNCSLPGEGSHNENVYLQVKNRTGKEVQCKWNTEFWYDGKCTGCEAGNTENHATLILAPGEVIEGSCATGGERALTLLSKMLNVDGSPLLTDFSLKNIQTTEMTRSGTK